ncbi:MAG: S9 family peptidase [Vicinamibacterales bacterium]|jgi:dipeptidyl aminopeptidase/acylaminoacyl peptidase|nr:S9 family peptidase [Vicinamibacterales bacterium]
MRRRPRLVPACAGVLCLCLLSPAAAQVRQGVLDKDTFMEMETVSNAAISPDGSQIVFSRGWVDKLKDQARSNIWIVDTAGTRLRELTRGSWRDSAPVWSPDGSRIAFLSDRDGTTQIHVLFAATGELSQLTHIDKTPAGLTWSPDGKQLAFTMSVSDDAPLLPVQLPKRPRGAEWAKGATIVDRLTWARDGEGPVEPGYTQVFTLNAATGGTPRQVTDGAFNHNNPEWSADGQAIFVSGIRKPDAEYLDNDSEIYAVDLTSLAVTPMTDRKGPDTNPAVSPDGRWIAYTGYDDKRFTSHVSSLYLMDRAGGSRRVWAGALNDSPSSTTWAPDSSGVYYLVRELGGTSLYFAPLKGERRKLGGGTQVFNGLSIANTGQAAAVRSTPLEPVHLVTFDVAHPTAARKLVDVNADVLESRALGQVEEMWFESKDGLKVQGWLVKPVGFQPGKKYPMVLWIHGGPWSMYDVGFSWSYQNFASLGYAVLYTNPRGSTGYGQDFVNGIQYAYPGKDYDDLMAGVDAALAKGFIDERNLFVCGGSGGGVLTAWIVGHTDRFAAAVSMRPVINWHSFVGTTDGPAWYRQFRKYPWEDPMEYAVRSPLHYVANVTTPTMVMTGEADLRTPMRQSEEFYRALKLLKKETLLVRMPDEFHGWRRPSHQLLQQLYLLAWFEKHKR